MNEEYDRAIDELLRRAQQEWRKMLELELARTQGRQVTDKEAAAISKVALWVARDGHDITNKKTVSEWKKEISSVSRYEAGMLEALECLGLGNAILE